jgi:hypothetical protein
LSNKEFIQFVLRAQDLTLEEMAEALANPKNDGKVTSGWNGGTYHVEVLLNNKRYKLVRGRIDLYQCQNE